MRQEVLCGRIQSSCACRLPIGHAGSHACTCGGRWTYDPEGRFEPVALPVLDNLIPVDDLREDDEAEG